MEFSIFSTMTNQQLGRMKIIKISFRPRVPSCFQYKKYTQKIIYKTSKNICFFLLNKLTDGFRGRSENH